MPPDAPAQSPAPSESGPAVPRLPRFGSKVLRRPSATDVSKRRVSAAAINEQRRLDHRERVQQAKRQLPHFHSLKRADTVNLEKARTRKHISANLLLDQQLGHTRHDNPYVRLYCYAHEREDGKRHHVAPLVYMLVKLPESAPAWRKIHIENKGQLVRAANRKSSFKGPDDGSSVPLNLDTPVEKPSAPAYTPKSKLVFSPGAFRAVDHDEVIKGGGGGEGGAALLPGDDQTRGAEGKKYTTMRDVLLHGRGSLGETVLHLLFLQYRGADLKTGAPMECMHRTTIRRLLQLPPGDGDSDRHPETGLSRGDLAALVNAHYNGATCPPARGSSHGQADQRSRLTCHSRPWAPWRGRPRRDGAPLCGGQERPADGAAAARLRRAPRPGARQRPLLLRAHRDVYGRLAHRLRRVPRPRADRRPAPRAGSPRTFPPASDPPRHEAVPLRRARD